MKKILGRDYEYFGCDISPKVVQLHDDPKIVKCDLNTDLPFKEQKFDYVICSGIVEYLTDAKKFLQKINRTYGKEKCLFLITMSNPSNILRRIEFSTGRLNVYSLLWHNFFSPHKFVAFLSQCQFSVSNYFAVSYIRNIKQGSLFGRMFPTLLGDQFLFLCTSDLKK